jgi:hypothetical protein
MLIPCAARSSDSCKRSASFRVMFVRAVLIEELSEALERPVLHEFNRTFALSHQLAYLSNLEPFAKPQNEYLLLARCELADGLADSLLSLIVLHFG